MKHTKDTENEKLKQVDCSILISDIKEKVQKLRDYGMSEREIVSQLFSSQAMHQLFVSKDYRIFFGDGRKEVRMEPLVKAVYLLFLSHPEGIVLKCLPDYRKELTALYLLLRPNGMTDRVIQSIEDVTNPTLNSINEKCTRIRKVFDRLLPKNVARYYSISGRRGEAKKIDLVRANVVWKCKLPNLQGL